MKRNLLIKHLSEKNCVLYREGTNHSMFRNPENGKKLPFQDIQTLTNTLHLISVNNWIFPNLKSIKKSHLQLYLS